MNVLQYATRRPRALGRMHGARFVFIIVCYLIAALPSGMLFGIYSSFFIAMLYLGRLPSYGTPDPKTLPGWVMAPSALMVPAMVFVPATVAFVAWRLRYRRPELLLIAPIALAIAAWALLVVDPFGAFNWWAD